MSMHLVGPYLTTTNYNRRNSKVTKAKMASWEASYKERCKFNKRMGLPKETFEEFLDIVQGRAKFKTKAVPLKSNVASVTSAMKQHRELYPSGNGFGTPGSTAKKEPQKYTGTLIKGIATMHKSNAVPIMNDKQAIEVATMRRG